VTGSVVGDERSGHRDGAVAVTGSVVGDERLADRVLRASQ